MADSREKLSPVTVALHWLLGLAIIGLLAVGLYMHDLPKGEFRSWLYGWHKVIGTTVLMVAALRILWRWRSGMPKPVADYPQWQRSAARASHYLLLFATVLMPLSGAALSYGGGHPVPILGLFQIGPPVAKIEWLSSAGHAIHEYGGWALIGIISLHVAGALKHHLVDRDGTLRRMLGARVG